MTVISERSFGKNFEGSGRDLILSYYFGVRLEELSIIKKKKPQSGQQVSRPRFETGTPE
jgi:hypothetical protein